MNISPREPLGSHHRSLRRGAAVLAVSAMTVGFTFATAGSASADESGDTTEANVAVLSGITMTGLTSSFLLTGTPGSTQTGAGAVTYNVETNNVAGYAVTVLAQQGTLDPADTVANTDNIPIADLTVRESGNGSYSPLSAVVGGEVPVHTQDGRSANGGDDLSTDFQIRVPVVDADTYRVTLDYVASTL